MTEFPKGPDAADAVLTVPFVFDSERAPGPDRMPARRLFSPERSPPFDPFLYFVHFGPRDVRETDWGFPAHPHKGFETITYMLEGQLEHYDSAGGHAVLEPGDVQWVTAGAGIVHSEIPPDAFKAAGGTVDGFQIWLNLARKDKAATPGYQMLRAGDMPVARPSDGVTLRIIGGAAADQASPVAMRTPISLIHARIEPGGVWRHQPAAGHNPFVYVFGGACDVGIANGGASARDGQVVLLGLDPGGVTLTATSDGPADLLYLAGTPIGEPIASYGPFVMTSREEIVEAIDDYNSGRMGVL
ncbi:MAG TPA: pirin family protein [Alphaproteobacteria bacterium]|nr:pirin family protein [Alphaproteobacteria bacterium]